MATDPRTQRLHSCTDVLHTVEVQCLLLCVREFAPAYDFGGQVVPILFATPIGVRGVRGARGL